MAKVGPSYPPPYDQSQMYPSVHTAEMQHPAYPPPAPPQYATGQGRPVGNHGNTRQRTSGSSSSDSSRFNASSFEDKNVRRGFIRRVYLLLFTQLLFTFGVVIVFTVVTAIKEFVRERVLVFYLSFAVFLVTFIVLVCIKSIRRKHPVNLICLAIFTLAFTYMVAVISSFFTTYSVAVAAAMTSMMCLSISLFAIQTKIDFTKMSILIFLIVMILVWFGVSCLVVMLGIRDGQILDAVYGGLACVIISVILIYHTQKIVGGKNRDELDPEEYVFAALQLYIDIVIIFIILLSCFGKQG